ncbi:TetR/AcrR family transcriptional regulator [Corynebacterium sp.]|uniref:TetR/AcrR family transcriptional regulator n=1 Tax=Corynebacterium sp. TaxID=1720 RepID=UPI003B3B4913
MARPREFSESAALDAAVAQFRVHGYADTSTEQLCTVAGVRRSSLYNTFGSKDELFIRALEHYLADTGGRQEDALNDEDLSGAERLDAVMDLILSEEDDAARRGHAAGCMVVNSRMAPDLVKQDERIGQLLDRGLAHQTSLLIQAVDVGRRDGSLKPDLRPRETALTVVSLISGIRVLAQAGTGPEDLRQVADLTLRGLKTA